MMLKFKLSEADLIAISSAISTGSPVDPQLYGGFSAEGWAATAPEEPGLWWLLGDPEFVTMGGNYSGTVPFECELNLVEVRRLESGMYGACQGQIVWFTPFDREKRQSGWVGLWKKVQLPEGLPPAVDA